MKILTYEEAKLNNSIVALGKFEGLHLGHMLLIDKVLELSLSGGFSTTVCTIEFPAEKQLNTNSERYTILEEKGLDYLIRCPFTKEFAGLSPELFFESVLVNKFGARFVVVGSDFRFGYRREGDVETLKEYGQKYGVDIVVLDKLSLDNSIVSTSLIRSLIETGDVKRAFNYLGRPYAIVGRVVSGKRLGRTIGFPTANIIPPAHKLLPAFGVYESRVCIDGICYKALTNVGSNPTVDTGDRVIVETNILDFSGDLYDKIIKIEFINFIRRELKFASIDGLVAQMNEDKAKLYDLT